MRYLIGIDVGTTGTKTILIDEIVGTQGKFIFLNNEEYAALDVVDADKNSDSIPILSES